MVVECSISRDTQVELLIFQMCTQAKVDFWQTAPQNDAVVGSNDTIPIYIFIKTITDGGSILLCMIVKICLCTGNSLIDISLELSYFLAHDCLIIAAEI